MTKDEAQVLHKHGFKMLAHSSYSKDIISVYFYLNCWYISLSLNHFNTKDILSSSLISKNTTILTRPVTDESLSHDIKTIKLVALKNAEQFLGAISKS